MDQAALAEVGMDLFATRLFLTSVYYLWIYDYFLTFADELKFAWSGRKSWVFGLFIASRYGPVLQIIWVNAAMFGNSKTFETKWFPPVYSSLITILTQITITLRVYAVTGRNNLLCSPLVLLIVAQICFAIGTVVWYMKHQLPQPPAEILNHFRICVYGRWKPGALIYVFSTFVFNVLAFSIIAVRAKKLGTSGYPGIPSLLNTILRDATVYFMFIHFIQFLALLFLFVTSGVVQILPAALNTTFVPIMAARIMLSLKKAAVEPAKPWSLTTMSNFAGGLPANETIHFMSQSIELESASQLLRNRGARE